MKLERPSVDQWLREAKADPSAAEAVTLEGETLTITGGGEDSRFAGLFPVVFYRGN